MLPGEPSPSNVGVAWSSSDEDEDEPEPTIHRAAERGKLELVKQMVRQNPLVVRDGGGRRGETPLHFACCGFGFTEVASFLLDHGAAVNAEDDDRNTPLHYAAEEGANFDLIKLLVARGADPLCENLWGFTPFLSACSSQFNCDDDKVVEYMLEKGEVKTSINHRFGREQSVTALHVATTGVNPEVVGVLLKVFKGWSEPLAKRRRG